MTSVRLIKTRNDRIAAGHPWVYANEVDRIDGEYRPGDIADLLDSRGRFLGRGYINPSSKILMRLLSRERENIDDEFFRTRLKEAAGFRKRYLPGVDSYRVVFAEADYLPGLVVDKFGEYLVLQTLTLGIDRWKDTIVECLDELFSPSGIYERNDAPVRELEGMRQITGFIKGPFDTLVDIEENGLCITVDAQKGQKTGYFLDQRENRAALRQYAAGRKVLDCFCYTGGFSLNAAAAGAESVTGVDQAQNALDLAFANAMKNGLAQCSFVQGNVFDHLRSLEAQQQSFDTVVLDPPAFARSKRALGSAVRGYKEINLRALRLLNPGGILVTCSCSHHMSDTLFMDTIRSAAADCGKSLRLLERRGQPKDHPILASAPETEYLKCLVFEAQRL